MRARWIIVAIAGFVAAAAWAAVAFTYFYLNPSIALFTAVATIAALSFGRFLLGLRGCAWLVNSVGAATNVGALTRSIFRQA